MATTTPNFGWPVPTSTDLVKNGAVAIEGLGDAIDASMLDFKGGTTGQVLAKATNTDMDFSWVAQDDSNAIQNALLTTTGDTIFASAASTPARRAIGTTGQVLTVTGGVPTWATPATSGTVGCAVFASALSFAYTANTEVAVPFANETFDTDSYHSTVTNTSRITIPTGKGGNYKINAFLGITGIGSTYSILKIFKNGSALTAEGLYQGAFVRAASGSSSDILNGTVTLPLVATDYIELIYLGSTATGTYTTYGQFSAILLP